MQEVTRGLKGGQSSNRGSRLQSRGRLEVSKGGYIKVRCPEAVRERPIVKVQKCMQNRAVKS